MSEIIINTENLKDKAPLLSVGDRVLFSGCVYTARDAAHKLITEIIDRGGELPFDLNGAVVYYAGPTQAPEHLPIGSCGPTTSSRMDVYTPKLLDAGLKGIVGKGPRSQTVCDSIVKNGATYFAAIGGAGALAAKCITSCEVIAFEHLGCESVKKLWFKDFPLIVAINSRGDNIFSSPSSF